MSSYELWKYLHILMFVFWLGTDMGVFLCARKSTQPSLSFETRLILLTMALRIELIPRTMWKAALPLGTMLSIRMGLLDISAGALALVWLFSIGWWVISMTGAIYGDKPFGQKLAQVNTVITGMVGSALIGIALLSYAGSGPFQADATWLLWKVGLYGVVNLTTLGILIMFEPMGAAFERMAAEGSSPELERIITRTMNRSILPVWSTYALIAFVAFIATTKIL
jgi:hypothetical protein